MKIDLNIDLGEGGQQDDALLAWASSVNIACGFHAGDAQTMLRMVRRARDAKVAIGAHPGFADRANFGRTEMHLPAETIYAQMIYQTGALKVMAESEGARLVHVKPHGMLYNQAAKDPQLARAITSAVKAVDPELILVGLAGSELIRAAEYDGLSVRQEVFADRGYLSDGTLVPRHHPGAMVESGDEAIARVLLMISERRVQSTDGHWINVNADTLCLHGDTPNAVDFARQLVNTLRRHGISISASSP